MSKWDLARVGGPLGNATERIRTNPGPVGPGKRWYPWGIQQKGLGRILGQWDLARDGTLLEHNRQDLNESWITGDRQEMFDLRGTRQRGIEQNFRGTAFIFEINILGKCIQIKF